MVAVYSRRCSPTSAAGSRRVGIHRGATKTRYRSPARQTGRPTGASSKNPIGSMPAPISSPCTVRFTLVPISVVRLPRIVA
jgi:hypothetical protein